MIEVEVSSSIMDDDLMIKVDCLILLGCMSESCSSSFEYVFLKPKSSNVHVFLIARRDNMIIFLMGEDNKHRHSLTLNIEY